MNQDNFQKWVDALRFGDYEQCRGNLHQNNKFCALGVLCDVAVKDGAEVRVSRGSEWMFPGLTFYDNEMAVPPRSVLEWLGVEMPETITPMYFFGARVPVVVPAELLGTEEFGATVMSLNDNYRFTFPTIADVLEATYGKASEVERATISIGA